MERGISRLNAAAAIQKAVISPETSNSNARINRRSPFRREGTVSQSPHCLTSGEAQRQLAVSWPEKLPRSLADRERDPRR
jgi:hypothetical protein